MTNAKLALAGVANAGKDTVANFLVDRHGFRRISFADPLKRVCMELFGLYEAQVYNNLLKERPLADHRWPFTSTDHLLSFVPLAVAATYDLFPADLQDPRKLSDEPLVVYPHMSPKALVESVTAQFIRWIVPLVDSEEARASVTPRVLLQLMGTEVFRAVNANTWIMAWVRAASRYPRVVAADCRFPNEVDAIKQMQGQAWLVKRDGAGTVSGHGHASETSLAGIEFDRIVENNAGIIELHERLSKLAAEMGW